MKRLQMKLPGYPITPGGGGGGCLGSESVSLIPECNKGNESPSEPQITGRSTPVYKRRSAALPWLGQWGWVVVVGGGWWEGGEL